MFSLNLRLHKISNLNFYTNCIPKCILGYCKKKDYEILNITFLGIGFKNGKLYVLNLDVCFSRFYFLMILQTRSSLLSENPPNSKIGTYYFILQ